MRSIAIAICVVFGLSMPVVADETVTLNSGKKIIVKDDGTWTEMKTNTQDSNMISITDLLLDASTLSGKQVNVQIDIVKCTSDTCFVKDHIMNVAVNIETLPRSDRKVLLTKCEHRAPCSVSVTGIVELDITDDPVINARSINFE